MEHSVEMVKRIEGFCAMEMTIGEYLREIALDLVQRTLQCSEMAEVNSVELEAQVACLRMIAEEFEDAKKAEEDNERLNDIE